MMFDKMLLLLLLGRVISVSVEVEILTARQMSAALDTEKRLGVFWCKSYNPSYWAPLSLLPPPGGSNYKLHHPGQLTPGSGSMFASQIINLFLHGCDCYGSQGGAGSHRFSAGKTKKFK